MPEDCVGIILQLGEKPDSFSTAENLIDTHSTASRADHKCEQRPDEQGFQARHPDPEAQGKGVIEDHKYSDRRAKACKQTKKYGNADQSFAPRHEHGEFASVGDDNRLKEWPIKGVRVLEV